MLNPIITALDIDDSQKALALSKELSPYVGGFKVGPRLMLKAEKDFLKKIKQSRIVFFDHKFFDIPSTTVASVKAAFDLGADWVTVHALNGEPCLKELALLEKTLKIKNPAFKILVVTVLTSFDSSSLPPIWKSLSINDSVISLARLAHQCGLNSFVCSPQEITAIKSVSPNSFIVTPGIRADQKSGDDQVRTATAAEALKLGASALVIGRPIIEAENPVLAAQKILSSLK